MRVSYNVRFYNQGPAAMSAIKNCTKCTSLYTGSTPVCANCYFSSLATKTQSVESSQLEPKSRAERRALEARLINISQRNSIELQPTKKPRSKKVKLSAKNTDKNREPQSGLISKTTNKNHWLGPPGVICPLCGQIVIPGQILAHKQQLHGERAVVPSPAQPRRDNQWVSVYSGGLPSLGKNSR